MGALEVGAGVVGATTAGFAWGVTGADVGAVSAGALLAGRGFVHIGQGALPGTVTAVGVGGDLAAGNFSWRTSFMPIVGLPSAYGAVATNCPEWF